MNLKNYTTEVPAAKSIDSIEMMLVSFGAKNIMKEYGPDQSVSGLSFILNTNGMKVPFRLPAKAEEIYKWLRKKYPQRQPKTLKPQSERICWKQMYEWVHINLSLVELEQADAMEVFFPYLYDVHKQETYYDKLKAGGYKNLLPSPQQ